MSRQSLIVQSVQPIICGDVHTLKNQECVQLSLVMTATAHLYLMQICAKVHSFEICNNKLNFHEMRLGHKTLIPQGFDPW